MDDYVFGHLHARERILMHMYIYLGMRDTLNEVVSLKTEIVY
jgi:hypothetical protein